MNSTTLEKQISKNLKSEKDSADSTIKTYIRNLQLLNDGNAIENFNFLENFDGIMNKLNMKNGNTMRNYLIAISSVLSLFKENPVAKRLHSKYVKVLDDKNLELKQFENSGEKTQTQKDNWIEWKQVGEKVDEYAKKVSKFKDDDEIDKRDYKVLLEYTLLSLYYYQPPRRNQDYQYCNVVSNIDVSKLPDTTNYLDFQNDVFIFNKYKTKKVYGSQVIEISEELQDVLIIYFKFHPLLKNFDIVKDKINIPFLVKYDGKAFHTVNEFTLLFNKIFNKRVAVSMLRHSFLSDKYGDQIFEQVKDANAMAHNTDTQKMYVKKSDKVKQD